MINTKNLYFLLIFLICFSCMEPNDEDLWSIEEENILNTQGFCRNVSVSENIAYVAAGQSGVQIWDLQTGVKVHEYLGYSQAVSYTHLTLPTT